MLSLEKRSELLAEASRLKDSRERARLLQLLSRIDRADLLAEPELGYLLALSWFWAERHSDALLLARDLAEPCRRRGYDLLYRRRLNLEGSVLVEIGKLEEAEGAYLEVLQRSAAVGDQKWISIATRNLGALAAARGVWQKALIFTQRALTALNQIGDTYLIAGAHANLGNTYLGMGVPRIANSHFEEASELFRRSGFHTLESMTVEIDRALSINALGDHRRAEAMVQHAFRIVGNFVDTGDSVVRHRGEAFRALGAIRLSQGRLSEAQSALEAALNCAEEAGVPLLKGEVFELLADLARRTGRRLDGASWTQRAVETFLDAGADARAYRASERGTMGNVG